MVNALLRCTRSVRSTLRSGQGKARLNWFVLESLRQPDGHTRAGLDGRAQDLVTRRLLGAVLRDDELIRFATDSPENPKDFKEVISGLILMPGDKPHGGLRNKPLHAGEIQDRYRTNGGAGLTYCHLSLTMMLYTAEVLTRVTGKDWLNWKAPGGECIELSATFYSDFFRLRNARINGDYYFRDQRAIQNNTPYLGTFEVALRHWPTVPNLKALIRSIDRARTPRSWLCYYGLPLLTHGVDTP